MVMRYAPSIQQHSVEILTAQFHISGQLESIGPLLNHLNDPTRGNLVLSDVRMTPAISDSPLQPFSCPRLMLRKSEAALIYFSAAESRASIRPLPRRELLIVYTSVAICRGYLHMQPEVNVQDFVDVVTGEFLPATEARVFPLVHLSKPFPAEADLLLLGRRHMTLYHAP